MNQDFVEQIGNVLGSSARTIPNMSFPIIQNNRMKSMSQSFYIDTYESTNFRLFFCNNQYSMFYYRKILDGLKSVSHGLFALQRYTIYENFETCYIE